MRLSLLVLACTAAFAQPKPPDDIRLFLESFEAALKRSDEAIAEFFNSLNRTNFGVPGVTIGAGFGQIVNAFDARIIQFALKLKF